MELMDRDELIRKRDLLKEVMKKTTSPYCWRDFQKGIRRIEYQLRELEKGKKNDERTNSGRPY